MGIQWDTVFTSEYNTAFTGSYGGTLFPGCEFLSDAPFSNLVSARGALLSNCACIVGGVKLLNPKQAGTTFYQQLRMSKATKTHEILSTKNVYV